MQLISGVRGQGKGKERRDENFFFSVAIKSLFITAGRKRKKEKKQKKK
jgi:hypothetical protein